MKLLILIRHGEYEPDGSLSKIGVDRINTTTEKLIKLIPENYSVAIFSSNAPRAKQSAEIIAKSFETSFEEREILYSGKDKDPDFDAAIKLIEDNQKTDVLILVTHIEYVGYLQIIYSNKNLGTKSSGCPFFGEGDGMILDCELKRAKYIGRLDDICNKGEWRYLKFVIEIIYNTDKHGWLDMNKEEFEETLEEYPNLPVEVFAEPPFCEENSIGLFKISEIRLAGF